MLEKTYYTQYADTDYSTVCEIETEVEKIYKKAKKSTKDFETEMNGIEIFCSFNGAKVDVGFCIEHNNNQHGILELCSNQTDLKDAITEVVAFLFGKEITTFDALMNVKAEACIQMKKDIETYERIEMEDFRFFSSN